MDEQAQIKWRLVKNAHSRHSRLCIMLSTTGLHILHDAGVPDVGDYTTLIFVHGYGYHSGTFIRMIPHARKLGARLILVNRRDYPGAKPYSKEARRLLSPGTTDPDALRTAHSNLQRSSQSSSKKGTYLLPNAGGTPEASSSLGGDMGGLWITAFLAHISSSHHGQTLRQYVKRVIVYDTPSTTFGYPRPENIFDPFMLAMQGDRRFLTLDWFSGYFAHGSTVDTLEYKTPLPQPPTTQSTLSPVEKECLNARAPVSRGGSDQILAFDGYRCGLFREIWESALYLSPSSPSQSGIEIDIDVGRASAASVAEKESQWDDVEVRHVWCDMSFWETPHAALMIQAELADARAHGRRVRDVASVRLRGMNHFNHQRALGCRT
ncbi:hypothetical protein V8D89_003101 [Ganoderma adspersum]